MKYSLIAIAFVSLLACNSSTENDVEANATDSIPQQGNPMPTQTPSMPETAASMSDPVHTSSLSIDWTGTYTGTIPCDDCEGLQTTITLNGDLSFTAKATYLGKSSAPYEAQGTYKWLDDGTRIKMIGIDPAFMPYIFKVGENQIMCLNEIGEAFTGKLASRYALKKI
jgi:uncharacterized lipoprotein NlpE involved in copper resistance